MRSAEKIILAILIFLGCGIISCSDTRAVRLRYKAEQLYYETERMVKDAQIKPDASSAGGYAKFRKEYADLLNFCYAALDSMDRQKDSSEYAQVATITHHAAMRQAQLFFVSKRFDSSATTLSHLLSRTRLANYEAAPAYVLLGQSLQGNGKLDSAMSDYDKAIVLLDPPVDPAGQVVFGVFNVPKLIYRIYAQSGDSIKAKAELQKAKSYYQNLSVRYPQTSVGATALSFLARLYSEESNWSAVISTLEKLVDSTGRVNLSAQIEIGDILADRLELHDSALAMFNSVLTQLQGRDTIVRPVILLKRGLVYLNSKQYEKARQELADLQKQYPDYYSVNAMPQMARAQSFELEGNWTRAETEYEFLLTNYPNAEESFSTYFHLADYLSKQGRKAEADKVLQRAVQAFDRAAAQYAGTPREARALSFKADLQRRQSDWHGATATLGRIFEKFPQTETGQMAIRAEATIFRNELHDTTAADSLFKLYVRTVLSPEEAEAK